MTRKRGFGPFSYFFREIFKPQHTRCEVMGRKKYI